jgi:uncharacterized RDD family membrane protein YckC
VTTEWNTPYYDNDPGRPSFVPPRYAGFWIRFFSSLVDTIISLGLALLVGILVGVPIGTASGSGDAGWVFGFAAGAALYIAYHIIGTAIGGAYGKRMFGLRIVHADEFRVPGYGTSIIRFFAIGLLGAVNIVEFINYLWIIWDSKKQALHDKIASTLVIHV